MLIAALLLSLAAQVGPATAPDPATTPDAAAPTADPAPGEATPPADATPTVATPPLQVIDTTEQFSVDTPIITLLLDPAARRVIDKDLPGLSTDENLPKFQKKTLRQLQPLSGGQITDDLLAKVGTDLAAAAHAEPKGSGVR